ncbi:unnamed protein product [Moneuplotes crassus]|uniref:Uncharacterized protein n=1 Tax=Euplotes crassus TaxID=5936 RepID=A0AAD1XYJ2_EUPCR|nr:unnamed protein product [Moneuplotes crassus]
MKGGRIGKPDGRRGPANWAQCLAYLCPKLHQLQSIHCGTSILHFFIAHLP